MSFHNSSATAPMETHLSTASIQPEMQPGTRPKVLLGVSGSVAAIKVPNLATLLAEFADVKVMQLFNSEEQRMPIFSRGRNVCILYCR